MRAFIFLAVAFALFVATPTAAQEVEPEVTYGLCLDATSYCNDFFITAESVSAGIYQFTGYEYGCGYLDRGATGTLRVKDGMAYVSLFATDATGYDFGSTIFKNWAIDLGLGWAGTYTGQYIYISGGEFGSLGISGYGAAMYTCSDPGVATQSVDPDDAEIGG